MKIILNKITWKHRLACSFLGLDFRPLFLAPSTVGHLSRGAWCSEVFTSIPEARGLSETCGKARGRHMDVIGCVIIIHMAEECVV